MSRFQKIYNKLLLEASPPPPPEEEEEDSDNGPINFDLDGDSSSLDSQDMPSDLEAEEGPSAGQSSSINTPQDLELLAIAVNALNYNGNVNLNIYSDYESGKGNIRQILNYIENKVGQVDIDEEDISAFGLGEDINVGDIQGKSISDKLAYYSQHVPEFTTQQENFWTRIILNCLKYEGNNYNLAFSHVTPESAEAIYAKLKQDFNYDTTGMFDSIIKDRITGSSLKGPGVF